MFTLKIIIHNWFNRKVFENLLCNFMQLLLKEPIKIKLKMWYKVHYNRNFTTQNHKFLPYMGNTLNSYQWSKARDFLISGMPCASILQMMTANVLHSLQRRHSTAAASVVLFQGYSLCSLMCSLYQMLVTFGSIDYIFKSITWSHGKMLYISQC